MHGSRTHYPAKITPPEVSNKLERLRLYEKLDELSARHSLIWISAPGGSGKTTLCASWLNRRQYNQLWYECDERDNDLVNVVHYLSLAARKLAPRKKQQIPPLTPEYHADIATFIQRAGEEIAARLKDHGVMVLDNLQLVDDSAELMQLLPLMADCLQPSQTLIVLSRHVPPERFIALEARGKLAHIAWQDVRFTQEEWHALPRHLGQIACSDEQLQQLYRRTDGWIAGLILGLNSESGSVEDSIDSRSFDYFASEYFDALADDEKHSLLQIAYLPYLDLNVVSRLSGENSGPLLLKRLVRENRFVSRHGNYFSFHPLFHDFLQKRADDYYCAAKRQNILNNSAEQLAAAGNPEAGIDLWCRAGNQAAISEHFLQLAPQLFESGRFSRIQQILDSLPEAHIHHHAWLLYWRGAALCMSDVKSALQIMKQALDRFLQDNDANGSVISWFSAVHTIYMSWNETRSVAGWLDLFEEKIRPYLYQQHLIPPAKVISLLAQTYLFSCHHPERQQYWTEQLDQQISACQDAVLKTELLNAAVFISYVLGNAYHGQSYCRQLEELALNAKDKLQLSPLLHLQTLKNLIYGESFFGSVHKALALAEDALTLSNQYSLRVLDSSIYISACQAAIALGDKTRAQQYLDKMQGYQGYQGDHGINKANILNASIGLAIANKDYEQAISLCQQLISTTRDIGMSMFEVISQIYLAEASFYADVAEYPQRLAEAQKQVGRVVPDTVYQFRTGFLQAAACKRQGDEQQCRQWLEKSWREAKKLGPMFVHTATTAWACTAALDNDIETDFVTQYVERHRELLPPPENPLSQWPWLARIYLLGDFRIVVNHQPVAGRDMQVRRLLKFLAASANGIEVQSAVELLYGDTDTQHRASALRKVLQRLRQLLGSEHAILRDGEWLRLNRRLCWVDADAFTALVGEGSSASLDQALALYQGEFLKGETLEDITLISRRENLRGAFHFALLEKLNALDSTGEDDAAISLCRQALLLEPLAEAIYQRLIRLYVKAKRHDLAFACYEQCRRLLLAELDVEPAALTRALLEPSA